MNGNLVYQQWRYTGLLPMGHMYRVSCALLLTIRLSHSINDGRNKKLKSWTKGLLEWKERGIIPRKLKK